MSSIPQSAPSSQLLSHLAKNFAHYGVYLPIVGVVAGLFQNAMRFQADSHDGNKATPLQSYLLNKSIEQTNKELLYSFIPFFGAYKIFQLRAAEQAKKKSPEQYATIKMLIDACNQEDFTAAQKYLDKQQALIHELPRDYLLDAVRELKCELVEFLLKNGADTSGKFAAGMGTRAEFSEIVSRMLHGDEAKVRR